MKKVLPSLVFIIFLVCFLNSVYAAPLSEDSGELESGSLSGEVSLPGTVKYPDGTACSSASECLSQNCVDGYCCNSACSGTCDSCSVSGSEGTCTDTNSLCGGTGSSCYCSSGSCIACSSGYSCSSYACAVTTTTPVSSGGGGGGGGGAATTQPAGETETQVWADVTSGSSVTMDVVNPDIAVTEINLEVTETAKNVQLVVIALSSTPKTAVTMTGDIYQYLKIDITNLDNSGINRAVIQFQIPKSWLIEKNVGSSEIALFKYVNNKWIELNTKVLSSDHAYVYYEAATSGFSYFAIGIKEIKEEPKKEEDIPEQPVSEEKGEVIPEERKAPEITGAVVTVDEQKVTPLIVTWIVILLTIAATIFVVVEMIRKPPIIGTKEQRMVSKDIDKRINEIDKELEKLDKK